MAGLPVCGSPFGRRRSYTAMDDDFFFDDPARYSPPFTDEEYADQLCYHRGPNNFVGVDEFLDGVEDVFDEAVDDGEDEQQFPLSMAGTPVTEAPAAPKPKPTRRATIATAQSGGLRPTQTFGTCGKRFLYAFSGAHLRLSHFFVRPRNLDALKSRCGLAFSSQPQPAVSAIFV